MKHTSLLLLLILLQMLLVLPAVQAQTPDTSFTSRNRNTGPGVAGYFRSEGTDATVIFRQDGSGDLLHTFDNTTLRFRVFSNGDVRTNGVIESTVGGFKFPDGTTQASAASGLTLPFSQSVSSGLTAFDVTNNGNGSAGRFVSTNDPALLVETTGNTDGIDIDVGGDGLEISAGGEGVKVKSAGTIGIFVQSAGTLAGQFDGDVDINGTATVTGFKMPTGATNGHVFTSDGSGNASWQAAAGGLSLPFSQSISSSQTAFDVTNNGNGSAGRFVSTNDPALLIETTGSTDGIDIDAGDEGLEISAGGEGVKVKSAGTIGVFVQSAGSLAGRFDGNVTVNGTLSKTGGSFKIDHPLDPKNKYLYHSFVESPDMMNIYNGNATLDANGEAVVELPKWFEALNRDFRYQLTAVGAPGPSLHVAEEVQNNRFKIAGGQSGMKVSWQVTGIRKDAWAEKHRIPVEEWKPLEERGLYLHPEAFGQPKERRDVRALELREEEPDVQH